MGCSCEQGEGASPLFSPLGFEREQAAYQVAEVVHRDPRLFEIDRSRWTLASIRSGISWMQSLTLSVICQILHRFRLAYKRGRQHVHSPDRLSEQKVAAVRRARELAQQAPGQGGFLSADEQRANLRPLQRRAQRLS